MTRSTYLFRKWQDAEIELRALTGVIETQQKDAAITTVLNCVVEKSREKAQRAMREFLDEISRPT